MSKKVVTSKGIKRDHLGVVEPKMDEGIIMRIRPFFDLGYPARKTFRQKIDLKGNPIKMPTLKTIIRYFGIWRNEHTYSIRENLAKHQRSIKAELVDQYEEIILRSVKLYHENRKYVDENKNKLDNDYYWFPKMIQQLTDHNTLIGELIASKARLEMAPYIDQTSEEAIKKKLEDDVEKVALQQMKNKK